MAKAADADFRLFLINRERDPAFRAGTRIKSGSLAFAIAPSNGSPAARSGRSAAICRDWVAQKIQKKSRAGALRCSTAGRDAPVHDHALPVGRFLDGDQSEAASLMAARALALPMLARSAIRAKGSEHFPLAWASFRMTASTAIASVFRCSATSGGTTTVEARNRRPHTTRRTAGSLFLLVSSIAKFDPLLALD